MNKLVDVIKNLDPEDKLWIKYFKKGRIFARYGYFSTYEDGTLTLLVSSNRKNDRILISRLPLKLEEIFFIGNVTKERIEFVDTNYMDVVK